MWRVIVYKDGLEVWRGEFHHKEIAEQTAEEKRKQGYEVKVENV